MLKHMLTDNFRYFFARINPSATVTSQAASEYNSIKRVLENHPTLGSDLNAHCYGQGSYGWETAIHDINDVDVIPFLEGLHFPPTSVGGPGTSWDRSRIFVGSMRVISLANDDVT